MKGGLVIIVLVLLAGLFPFCRLSGQSVTPMILGASGHTYSSQDFSLDWTAGEAVIPTFESNGLFLTQGFHQPSYLLDVQVIEGPEPVVCHWFPNPASNTIHIDVGTQMKETIVCIFDLAGNRIKTKYFSGESFEIDVSAFPPGTYLLEVGSQGSETRYTFRWIKM